MSIIKLVVSDLHLADSSSMLDGFGERQQLAFEGLVRATFPGGPLDQTQVELIINGDCFDFLATPPFTFAKEARPALAEEKIAKIIQAHPAFFQLLRAFVEVPGRRITFIIGNHDIELAFAAVRARVCSAIIGEAADARIYFCPDRFYYPLPDVYVEHGNYYDYWNHVQEDLWDLTGRALDTDPQSVSFPIGSLYYLQVLRIMNERYAYFDHFEPPMSYVRQVALLCLLNPALVAEMAQRSLAMLEDGSQSRVLALWQEGNTVPAQLFEGAMLDFVKSSEGMFRQKSDLIAPAENGQSAGIMQEFALLRDALMQPLAQAVGVICSSTVYETGESVTRGMCAVLEGNPAVRYAIAGHTHMPRADTIADGKQVYFNTSSWVSRIALPTQGEVSTEQLAWLRAPDWSNVPLRDLTCMRFALLTATEGGATRASLCAWEGGRDGSYRELA
ncbi:hypothetical protein EPA93_40665 [Ktedonosporobacter rubrisoli]|uniref:Calcineurin-like phosphoesterase domain-containing protein n=1 Tax=Ktedonosporobacter rubrisoli TaxID=2509675 RepID=A0A4P6K1C4_KTERU|nr:hypothetical protein [Ktedonosporobacter rubrisoli]QBD81957.1 hypothetical protein EPA93_40665 [Ktedonosporobacter rubrisoli]